jgi:hypothetical protein
VNNRRPPLHASIVVGRVDAVRKLAANPKVEAISALWLRAGLAFSFGGLIS